MHCTPGYRAPELFDVNSHCNIDERTDVWSLGCTLYCMCFYHSPFESLDDPGSQSVALAVIGGKAEFPAGHAYTSGLEGLVRYCLTYKGDDRPYIKVCTVCPQLFALNCLPSTKRSISRT
jgi:serine/threonine kinase 16